MHETVTKGCFGSGDRFYFVDVGVWRSVGRDILLDCLEMAVNALLADGNRLAQWKVYMVRNHNNGMQSIE